MALVATADGGGYIGFNEGKIKSSVSKLQAAYNKLYSVLCDTQQSKVVNELSKAWYCEEAVAFFKELKSVMDSELDVVTNSMDRIITEISGAAKGWASATGSSVSIPSFSKKTKKLDVTGAKKQDSSGNKGANQRVMEDVVKAFESIKSSASTALSDAKTAVRTSGFYDKNSTQQAQIEAALSRISQSIQSKIDSLIATLNKEINNTISKYGSIISKNASNFKGISSSATGSSSGKIFKK